MLAAREEDTRLGQEPSVTSVWLTDFPNHIYIFGCSEYLLGGLMDWYHHFQSSCLGPLQRKLTQLSSPDFPISLWITAVVKSIADQCENLITMSTETLRNKSWDGGGVNGTRIYELVNNHPWEHFGLSSGGMFFIPWQAWRRRTPLRTRPWSASEGNPAWPTPPSFVSRRNLVSYLELHSQKMPFTVSAGSQIQRSLPQDLSLGWVGEKSSGTVWEWERLCVIQFWPFWQQM